MGTPHTDRRRSAIGSVHRTRTISFAPATSVIHAGCVAERCCSRLADDVRATTGHLLEVRVLTSDENWTEIKVDLDGKPLGSVSRYFAEDPEEFIAEVADALQEAFLDEEIWGGWPTCPNHGTHPLTAGVDDDRIATWFCRNGGPIARIGSLPERT